MRRREFIGSYRRRGGCLAAVWRRAQQAAMPVVGFLAISSRDTYGYLVDAFRQGLRESRLRRGTERRDRIPLGGRSN